MGLDHHGPPLDRQPSLVERVRAALDESRPGLGGPPEPESELDRERAPADAEEAPRARRRNLRVPALVALVVLLTVALAGSAGLAFVNAQRADEWETRAEQVELKVGIINDLLVERSHDLNQQTKLLNATAAKLRGTKRALARSEADVRALVRRQAELASEKARAEDSR